MSGANFSRRHFIGGAVALTAAATATVGQSVAFEPRSRLAFTRAGNALRFDTGVLKGTLAEGGKALGLQPVTHISSATQVAGPYGIFSPYRMLTADARFGTAAWEWPCAVEVLPDGAARLHWSPDRDHPLEMTGVYRWTASDTLDLVLTVKPQRDLRRFELFLASYFNGFPQALACVRQPAAAATPFRFVEAVKSGGDWQTFPRDAESAAIFADGRWSRPPNPVRWKIMPRLAAPLALRRDAKSELTAVLMSRPGDCFAVSMPYGDEGHRSIYLSLFGMDLAAGKQASAAARLVIGKDIGDRKAWEFYQQYAAIAGKDKQASSPTIIDSAFCSSLTYAGVAVQEPGWHIWGCSPIVGEDGKTHLFVERWPVKSAACPRDFDAAWRHDSQIAHYVGEKAQGPFKFRDVVLRGTGTDTWDRFAPANPCIQKVDGKYVLLYIANPVGVTKGIAAHAATQRIGMAVSDALDGPWTKVGQDGKILDPSPDPEHWTYGAQVVNPAFLKHRNGKYLLYFKGKGASMGVAVADKLEGPYVHQSQKLSSNAIRVEDGTALMVGGKVCLLTTDNHGMYGHGGGLFWISEDGIHFNSVPERGYYPPSHYFPKTPRSMMRRYYGAGTFQRPQVLVQNGRPTHLYVASGTVINGGDGTLCYVLACKPENDQ